MSLQIDRHTTPTGINPPKQYSQHSETISPIPFCCLAHAHIVFSPALRQWSYPHYFTLFSSDTNSIGLDHKYFFSVTVLPCSPSHTLMPKGTVHMNITEERTQVMNNI